MKNFFKGLIYDNPIFVLLLGLCSSLAVTTKFEDAYLMGLCLLFVLICSNFIICIIKKLVPSNVQIPVYILIIGTFVTILEILLSKYIKPLYDSLGIYLSLIVVNCIVLGRAIEVASKKGAKDTFLDSLKIGLGYTLSLSLIAFIREILGNATLTLTDSIASMFGYMPVIIKLPTSMYFPISLFKETAGAFLTLGILIAIFNYYKNKEEK